MRNQIIASLRMANAPLLAEFGSVSSRQTRRASPQEIRAIFDLLGAMPGGEMPPSMRRKLLVDLFARAQIVIEGFCRELVFTRHPIRNSIRSTVQAIQETLGRFAMIGLELAGESNGDCNEGESTFVEAALWVVLDALAKKQFIYRLISAPCDPEDWRKIKRTFRIIQCRQIENWTPVNGNMSLQANFCHILIAGAVSPVSLNALEWDFLNLYLKRKSPLLKVVLANTSNERLAIVWMSVENCDPPKILHRRPPHEDAPAFYLNCSDILLDVKRLLSSIETEISLPKAPSIGVSARTARIVLNRLAHELSSERKRRFTRRRKSYRAHLCFGFDEVYRILAGGNDCEIDLSEWLIVNESPSGYATMHLSGRLQKARVGDLVAMKQCERSAWVVCVVRWVLSSNPEHLEFGLEELSQRTLAGHIATPSQADASYIRALLLLPLPPLRESEAVCFPPLSRPDSSFDHIFITSGNEFRIKEFKIGSPIELTSGIEVVAMAQPDCPITNRSELDTNASSITKE